VTRVRRSLLTLAGAAMVWLGVACLDVSSPISGIASISRIVAPTPSVVTADSLRDTVGRLDSLRVYAFAPNGDTVKDAIVRFYVVDTLHKLHVDSLSGFVWADTGVSPNAAVFAMIQPSKGKGSIVTPLDTIPVVPAPVSVTRDTNFLFTFNPLATDTLSSDLISAPFGATIKGGDDTPVQKYIVGFQIVRYPAAKANNVDSSLVLTSALSTNDSSYGVSDASGHATLRLRVRRTAIKDSLLLGLITDSAVVRLRVRRGRDTLVITPDDSNIIAIKAKLP
jgi:hypothetical protein